MSVSVSGKTELHLPSEYIRSEPGSSRYRFPWSVQGGGGMWQQLVEGVELAEHPPLDLEH